MSRWQKTGVLCFAALLLLCILCSGLTGPYANGYRRSFDSDFGLVPGQTAAGGDVAVETEPVSLLAGDYAATIFYSCDEPGSYMTLSSYHDQVYLGNVKVPLEPDGQSVQFSFTLADTISDMSVRVYYGGSGSLSVSRIRLESVDGGPGFLREFILLCAVALAVCGALWLYMKRAKLQPREKEYLLLVCGAALLASAPLFMPYLIEGDDSRVHLMRIEGIVSSLAAGQFPVRMHAATYSGYGLPLSVFYPELFLYPAAALRMLGMSLTSVMQLMLALVNLASGVAMFHTGRYIFRSARAGAFAAVLYLMASYRLYNVYNRGDLGEALAMVFVPLAVCGMYELFFGQGRWLLLAVSFTGVYQSHVLSAFQTLLFCGVYGLVSIGRLRDRRRLAGLCKAGAAALLLNVWTLIPMIQYMGLDMTGELLWATPSGTAMYPLRLLQAMTNAAPGEYMTGTQDVQLQTGAAILAGSLLFLAVAYRRRRKAEEGREGFGPALTFFLMGVFATFMTTIYFPWELVERIPVLGDAAVYLQFSMRLLEYADVLLSLAAAYALGCVTEKDGRLAVALVLAVSMLTVGPSFNAFAEKQPYVYRGETVSTAVDIPEYKYPGTITNLLRGGEPPRGDGAQWSSYSKKGTDVTVYGVSTGGQEGTMTVPLLWYPGYRAVLDDGQELTTERGFNNVIQVRLPAGTEGTLHVWFAGFPLWRAAEAVSLLTAASMAVWPLLRRRAARKKAAG